MRQVLTMERGERGRKGIAYVARAEQRNGVTVYRCGACFRGLLRLGVQKECAVCGRKIRVQSTDEHKDG